MRELITITGDVGSGKSTAAKIIAASLEYEYISTGMMQREIAGRRGVTTLQLNEASMDNSQVDDEIDSYVIRLGTEGRLLVLDSRMAWHFVGESFKVFIAVDPYIGARRVLDDRRSEEVHRDITDAVRNNLRRKELEDKRFAKLYGVRCDALENFDVVVDSTWVTPQRVADVVNHAFLHNQSKEPHSRAFICPKRLYPTKCAAEVASHRTDEILATMSAGGFDSLSPVEVVRFSNYFFVHDGHKRISCALRLGLDHVPCLLRDIDDAGTGGLKLRDEIIASLKRPWIHDWEVTHGFKYPSYPDIDGNPRLEFE
jgi:CMP/dCMP kinase